MRFLEISGAKEQTFIQLHKFLSKKSTFVCTNHPLLCKKKSHFDIFYTYLYVIQHNFFLNTFPSERISVSQVFKLIRIAFQ